MSLPDHIILSQSFVKAMDETKGTCPRRARAVYIEGLESGTTNAMNNGNYFETLTLGQNVNGTQATMRRLAGGAKSTDQMRIEAQAKKFVEEWVPMYNMDLSRSHITLWVRLGRRYWYRARLDLVTPMFDPAISEHIMPNVLTDIKLTKDIHSTFGPFSWGAPERMDHTQAYGYTWAWEKNFGERLPFYYFVVGYSRIGDHKRVFKKVEDSHIEGFKQSLRDTVAKIEYHEARGEWPRIPSSENCNTCPLKGNCPQFKLGGTTHIVQ